MKDPDVCFQRGGWFSLSSSLMFVKYVGCFCVTGNWPSWLHVNRWGAGKQDPAPTFTPAGLSQVLAASLRRLKTQESSEAFQEGPAEER